MPNKILTLADYGDKSRTNTYRTPRDINEMISYCDSHSHISFLTAKGDARVAKVNGKVRTWKRDRNRVEVPCKYGLYEYFTLTARDIDEVLIPVAESEIPQKGTGYAN